jgi:hypothetical protein
MPWCVENLITTLTAGLPANRHARAWIEPEREYEVTEEDAAASNILVAGEVFTVPEYLHVVIHSDPEDDKTMGFVSDLPMTLMDAPLDTVVSALIEDSGLYLDKSPKVV